MAPQGTKKKSSAGPKNRGQKPTRKGRFLPLLLFFSFIYEHIYIYIYMRIYFLFFFCVTFLLFFISFLFFFWLPQKPSFITPCNPLWFEGFMQDYFDIFLILFVTFVDRNCVMWYNVYVWNCFCFMGYLFCGTCLTYIGAFGFYQTLSRCRSKTDKVSQPQRKIRSKGKISLLIIII